MVWRAHTLEGSQFYPLLESQMCFHTWKQVIQKKDQMLMGRCGPKGFPVPGDGGSFVVGCGVLGMRLVGFVSLNVLGAERTLYIHVDLSAFFQ